MKKTFRLLGMICLAGTLVVASSCKKNEETTKVTIGLPQFEEVEGEPGEEAKAYIDFNANGAFKWNANDQIMIYNLDAENGANTAKAVYTTDANAEGQSVVTFTGADLGKKKSHFFIFYPVSKVATGTNSLDVDNYETFNVPAVQTYTTINGNPTIDPTSLAAACEVSSLSEQFTLNHIFGVCRLKLKGTKAVRSIVLHDNAMALAGNVTMKLNKVEMARFSDLLDQYTLIQDGQAELNSQFVQAWNQYRTELGYSAEANGNDITLNCPDVKLNPTTQTLFYISVRPGAFIKGFTITVNFADGTSTTLNNYANPKNSYRIRAGFITGFAPSTVLP
jgi:hypothetical protein